MTKARFIQIFPLAWTIALGGCGSDDLDTATNTQDQGTESQEDAASDSESTDADTDDKETSSQDPTNIDSDTRSEDEAVGPCSEPATKFPLSKGDCVPDFELPAHDGTTVKLSDLRGQWVVFSSFPAAGTLVCTGQMQKLDEMYDEFIEANIQPYGFNNEAPAKKETWCESMGIAKLLILSDHKPRDAVSKMFGISGMFTKRADTVIDPDGRFVFMRPNAGASSIPPLLRDIQAMQNP